MRQPSNWLYLSIFVAAAGAAIMLTPAAMRLARRLGHADQPDGSRHHVEPVALFGGLAIYGGAFAGAWLMAPGARPELKGFFIAGLVMLVSGLQDDVASMDPWLKTLAQVAGALVLVGFGVQVQLVGVAVIDVALTVGWIVAVVNAFNYQDNMNGLAAGLATTCALGFFAIAVAEQQYLVAILAIGLAGGSAGFLRYNFPKARIFMGDAGSMFIGFVLAFLGIRLRFLDAPKTATFFVPAIVVAVPLFDAALVTVSRLRRRVPVTQGGTDHSSHRLVRAGLRPASAVALLWAAQAACAAAAFAITRLSWTGDLIVAGVLAAVALVAGISLERRQHTAPLPRGAEAS